MSEALRDENRATTLLGVSNADGTTPVAIYADPTTHRLLVSGSNRITYTAATAGTYAVLTTDSYIKCASATTLTLPTAVGNLLRYVIKNTSTGSVVIGTTSSQTIDGISTYTLSVQYSSVEIWSDGANWNIS